MPGILFQEIIDAVVSVRHNEFKDSAEVFICFLEILRQLRAGKNNREIKKYNFGSIVFFCCKSTYEYCNILTITINWC